MIRTIAWATLLAPSETLPIAKQLFSHCLPNAWVAARRLRAA